MLAIGIHGDDCLVAMQQRIANPRLHATPCAHGEHRIQHAGTCRAGNGCRIVRALVIDDQHIVPALRMQMLQHAADGAGFVARGDYHQEVLAPSRFFRLWGHQLIAGDERFCAGGNREIFKQGTLSRSTKCRALFGLVLQVLERRPPARNTVFRGYAQASIGL